MVNAVIDVDAEKTPVKNITALSTYHNFRFTEKGLIAWKAFGIGEGKALSLI